MALYSILVLLIIRRETNNTISPPTKKTVSLKALKNKDKMSLEKTLKIFSPDVQRALAKKDVVVTIVPEAFTFWQQTRPGTVVCTIDIVVHGENGIY